MIDYLSCTHKLNSCEINAWKNIASLIWIRTHDLREISTVLNQVSYEAILELITPYIFAFIIWRRVFYWKLNHS